MDTKYCTGSMITIRLLINNRHMFYQLLVNKTLSFINNRPMFYQLIVNKNTIFYDDGKPEAATAV